MTTKIAVTYSEAAALVSRPVPTIRHAVDRKELPAKRIDGRILVKVTDLEAWFDRQPDAR